MSWDLPPGRYRVTILVPNELPLIRELTLDYDHSEEVVFLPGLPIAMQIQQAGAPVGNTHFTLVTAGAPPESAALSISTDALGHAPILLRPGSYLLKDPEGRSTPFQVKDHTQAVTIELPSEASTTSR